MDFKTQVRPRSALSMSLEIAKMATCMQPESALKTLLRSSYEPKPCSLKNDIFSQISEMEWTLSNEKFYDRSTRERLNARKLKDDVSQIVKVIDFQTRQRQINNTQKLAVRISNIAHWKEELSKEITLMKNQRFDVDNHLINLEKLLQATSCPLTISLNCIRARQKRTGVDATKDNVELALLKEVDVIKKCQRSLKCFIIKAEAQNKTNRGAQESCDRDLKNKKHAQELDDEMLLLHNSSENIRYSPGVESLNSVAVSHPLSWAKHTYENVHKSQKEREKSQKLCNQIDECMKTSIDEISKQYNSVNAALKLKVQNLLIAKNNFQMHLQQVKIQIQDQERIAEVLKKAIMEKESPLKVAQTRMSERNKRVDMELCHDLVTNGLQSEVLGIKEAIQTLKSKLQLVLQSIEKLQKLQTTLEHEINVKENSLEIDSKICMHLRKSMIQGINSSALEMTPHMP